MTKKVVLDDELNEEIYQHRGIVIFLLVISFFLFLVIGFIANFPLKDIANEQLTTLLGGNPQCTIRYDDLSISTIPPKAVIKNPLIQGNCFGRPGNNLKLDSITLGLALPSFSPLGLALSAKIKKGRSFFKARPIVGIGKAYLNLGPSNFDASILKDILGKSPVKGSLKFSGSVEIPLGGTFRASRIGKGKINLESRNLEIPAQNLKGFLFPSTPVKKLKILANYGRGGEISFKAFDLGTESSPLTLKLGGKIKLNHKNMNASKVDLKGKVKFSPQFKSTFGALNLFIKGQKPDGEGYHALEIAGTFGGGVNPKFPQ